MIRHQAGAALAALALTGASACGGGQHAAASSVPASPLPCTARTGVALPAGWPPAVPLPTGLVVTRTEQRSGGRLIAYGRVGDDLHTVVQFFNTRLPAAGFKQRNGEIDRYDAESDFVGRTAQGRWTVGRSPECQDQSSVTLLVQPKGTAGGSSG